jgi:hypothetical protein
MIRAGMTARRLLRTGRHRDRVPRMKRLLLVPALLLAACAQEPSDAALVLEEVLAAHQASLAAIPGAPAPPPASPSRPPVAAPALAAAPAPAPGGPHAAPRRTGSGEVAVAGALVGHTPEELILLLGEPRLRRSEGPAEVWHYQATQCHLDVILYPDDGPRAALRVGFAAARAVGTARRGEAACLRDIARGAGPVTPSWNGGFGMGA